MLQQAFDRYAESYDRHFTRSLIGKAQRARVYRQLDKALRSLRGGVLELNCGTGEDAAYISSKGYRVTASDISPEMIRVASQKEGNGSVKFLTAAIQELDGQLEQAGYACVFSNFGGLNCLSPAEMERLAGQAHRWLQEGALLVAVVMGRRCGWERFFFRWRKEPEKARRRASATGVDTEIEGRSFQTWYYSPRELSRICGAHFEVKRVKPIGLFVPPSYLEAWIAPRPRFFALLKALESLFGNIRFFSDYADHYFIVLQKKRL